MAALVNGRQRRVIYMGLEGQGLFWSPGPQVSHLLLTGQGLFQSPGPQMSHLLLTGQGLFRSPGVTSAPRC